MEVAKRAKCFGINITAITRHPDTKKLKEIDNNGYNNKMNFFVNKIPEVKDLLDSLIDADYISILYR
jgi:lactate dehydrogenase-like 2-hydroxyacid dehydrogenase